MRAGAENGRDLTFIELMPMGGIGNEMRIDQFWSLQELRVSLRASEDDGLLDQVIRAAIRLGPKGHGSDYLRGVEGRIRRRIGHTGE